MSVIAWDETGDGDFGESTEDGVKHTRNFNVQTNSASDSSVSILSHASCPKVGDFLSSAVLTRICTNVKAVRHGNTRVLWKVTATYENRITDADGTRLEIWFGARKVQRPMKWAYDIEEEYVGCPVYNASTHPARRIKTKWVINSAGEPFDEPYVREFSNTLIHIRRNEFNIDPNILMMYRDTVNIDDVTIASIFIPKMWGKINTIDIDPQVDSEGTFFYKVEYEIEVAFEEAWWAPLINIGHNYLDGDGKPQPVKDDMNRPTTKPQLLAADGNRNAPDADPTYTLYYTWYPTFWSPLGLPAQIGMINQ